MSSSPSPSSAPSPPSSPCLPMSQIIASDAPLLSPADAHFPPDVFAQQYSYYLPPSPPVSVGSAPSDSPLPAQRMLKMRAGPDALLDADPLCLPTHQLFDFAQQPFDPPFHPLSPAASPRMHHQRLSLSIKPPVLPQHHSHAALDIAAPVAKRPVSPGTTHLPALPSTKKPRDRVSTRDFVPPDVSGLSKREARLVKNRAAAFLSRQRKREEFELMEVRVAELEKENARLLAMARNSSGSVSHPSTAAPEMTSEVEQLRAQLAAAHERERELAAEVERTVKVESLEPGLASPPSRAASLQPQKSGVGLGFMALLCALPSLISMPAHNPMPASMSFPESVSSPTSTQSFDFNAFMPREYDGSWSNGVDMPASAPLPSTRRLELSSDAVTAGALSGLDISFDASPSDDGKIRVRIHSPSSATLSSRSGSPGSSSASSAYTGSPFQHPGSFSSALLTPPTSGSSPSGMWLDSTGESAGRDAQQAGFMSYPHQQQAGAASDPFFGIGGFDFGMSSPEALMYGSSGSSEVGMEFAASDFGDMSPEAGRKRVRIALKSLPQEGGREGGEWEVQIC